MTDFFDPAYVTYRVLQADVTTPDRESFRRTLATFLKPYPSAIQFAEQFSQVETNMVREHLHYKSEPRKMKRVYKAMLTYQPTIGSTKPTPFTMSIVPHDFRTISAKGENGSREIAAPQHLLRHDNERNPMSMGYINPTGYSSSSMDSLGEYIPWNGWLPGAYTASFTSGMMNMIFAKEDDAEAYMARVIQGRRKVDKFDFAEFVKAGV
jgi:hypothetical protein